MRLAAGHSRHYGSWSPVQPTPPGLQVCEVLLHDGPLLEDGAFLTEHATALPGGGYRWTSLADRLSAEALLAHHRRLAALLDRLTQRPAFVLWLPRLSDEDLEDLAPRHAVHLQAHCDHPVHALNGALTVAEVRRDDLPHGLAAHAGRFDALAGLSVDTDGIFPVLAALSLADPHPTLSRRGGRIRHTATTGALAAVAGLGGVFFEECDNGTRLRLVSADPALPDRVAAAVGSAP